MSLFVVIHEPVLSTVGHDDIDYDACGGYDYENNNCNNAV